MSFKDASQNVSSTTRTRTIRNHRDLIVWQKAMDLVVNVYSISNGFPRSETYGLTTQVRRAVSSVPANIAEGQGRRLPGEFLNFLGNARGSLWELDTHLELAHRLAYINNEQYESVNGQPWDVARLLNGLMRSLR